MICVCAICEISIRNVVYFQLVDTAPSLVRVGVAAGDVSGRHDVDDVLHAAERTPPLSVGC